MKVVSVTTHQAWLSNLTMSFRGMIYLVRVLTSKNTIIKGYLYALGNGLPMASSVIYGLSVEESRMLS